MQELMKRSETIEADAWSDLYRRAPGPLRQRLGLEVERGFGVTVLSATRVDHLLLNRAIGLGHAPQAREAAAMAIGHYARRGIERYWIHLGSQFRNGELPRHLEARGIALYPRGWMKFARRIARDEAFENELVARPARPGDLEAIGRIVAPAFDLPEEARPLLSAAIGSEGWHYFVVELDGRIVAASALFTRGKDAVLVFAATHPEARRRGCQRALMMRRLGLAQRLGCDYAFTETGVPVDGESGPSYRNMLRAGFDELYLRDNFAPEGTRWHKHPSSDATEKSNVSPKPSTMPLGAMVPSGT